MTRRLAKPRLEQGHIGGRTLLRTGGPPESPGRPLEVRGDAHRREMVTTSPRHRIRLMTHSLTQLSRDSVKGEGEKRHISTFIMPLLTGLSHIGRWRTFSAQMSRSFRFRCTERMCT